MAIQKKHGKGRLDKWYKLAKEKGYRARAAFKLIQLNKKYGFLEKSKVLLDLCAAPGSWCQVAAETMPTGSLIIGVDLAPIKAIPRVISFQSDITTDKCRATIRQHIKHLKCDTVLHDGAPNVGVAWVQDAFSQAELVLQSMKLATEFLKEGGTFVTKVFRSKDYNALLWVFKQLFTTVEATKPPSSRNVSAEIFVVCRGFKAPKRLDPKFLDPKHVFAELQAPTPNNEAKVFNPEKKKRKREGYEEGDYTQHKEVPVSEFIHTTDPIAILGTVNKLSFEQTDNGDLALATLDRLPETTAEIRQCCADLKVLGKKEFRSLLRWRLKVRDKFGMSSKALKAQAEEAQKPQDRGGEGDEVAEVESMDEELKVQEELQRIRDMNTKEKKKERRKENEQKRKEIIRMQMHMTTPHDIGLEQQGPAGEGSMFQIKSAEKAKDPTRISTGRMEDVEDLDSDDSEMEETDEDSDDDGDRLERELDAMYESFQEKRQENDAKARAKKARKEKETDEWGGLSDEDKEEGAETDGEFDDEDGYGMHQLPSAEGLSMKAAMFFDQDIFQDLGIEGDQEDNDSAIELEDESSDQSGTKTGASKSTKPTAGATAKPLKSALKSSGKSAAEESDSEDESVIPSATVPSNRPEDPLLPNGQLDVDIITAEAMTLAQSLATKKVKASDLIDDGFNKYTLRDTDGLPEWFLDDENHHSKPHRPISAAAAAAIKEKLRALNARPIKKVMEAKGRKKMRAAARLEKLKKKSALLMEDEGVSEKDKVGMIERMIKRATKKGKPKEKVKLVVARGGNRGIAGRPRGVKGKYKIVDPRLKKDVRAEKRLKRKLKK
ncbi:ribosomal RNA large subunit methyltransferase J [Exophiala mesophila]|uniref:Ribosomal RNA large subunit methyltransferase J n=1 Tax=Exophiala mesophila TaxID=212818 RepID=A0A0D2A3I6_EXOME|nr:ribosomal RNA large subunit methyltransferase J [Exophiala mesophila]KIV93538.1 ribosomal RNA large subunit methyltransferase J [Exophiala mesophila]